MEASFPDFERLLIVVAHPDDCEFSCGGTAARYADAGADVRLVVVTDGATGSHDPELPASELSARRREEQLRASEVIGVREVTFLEEPDGATAATPALVTRLVEAIRAARPELVVTHDPWRQYMLHPDHLAVGEATWRAIYAAREPRLHRDLAAAGLDAVRPREAWLFAAQDPNWTVDTTDYQARRERGILCHESQAPTSLGFEPGDEAGAQRFLDQLRRDTAGVGRRVGAPYGEEFRRVVL